MKELTQKIKTLLMFLGITIFVGGAFIGSILTLMYLFLMATGQI